MNATIANHEPVGCAPARNTPGAGATWRGERATYRTIADELLS